MKTDDLTLSANGLKISGWQEISVTLRAEGFPPSFEVALSSRDPISSSDVIVRPGDECEISLGADRVITGYVDRVSNSTEAENHILHVVGRGKTQDLVDCSAEWPSGQISEGDTLAIASQLASAYGISVKLRAGAGAGPTVPQMNLNYGETGAGIIQRMAQAAGLLAYEDANGVLLLAAVGTVSAASGAVYGKNVEACSVTLSMDQRYSEYVCAQLPQDVIADTGEGGFFFDTETDTGVPRHRRMYLVQESVATGDPQEFTRQKARWERSRRQGRGTSVAVTIDSWRDSAGVLWAPNTLIPVSVPGLPASASPLCISEVTFRRGGDGTHADLILLPAGAFAPEPLSLLAVNLSDQDEVK